MCSTHCHGFGGKGFVLVWSRSDKWIINYSTEYRHLCRILQDWNSPSTKPHQNPQIQSIGLFLKIYFTHVYFDFETLKHCYCAQNEEFTLTLTLALVTEPNHRHTMVLVQRPPDGGWGWVIVFVSFTYHVLMGIVYAINVLYVAWLDEFDQGKGLTSWVLTIFYTAQMVVGMYGFTIYVYILFFFNSLLWYY